MKRSMAEIVREYGPFPGADRVQGVTYDGQHVWFASGDKLNAFDPASGKSVRSNVLERLEMPRGAYVKGLESDGRDQFFYGEGPSGKVRAVRGPRRVPHDDACTGCGRW
jgi:hypothetical protein